MTSVNLRKRSIIRHVGCQLGLPPVIRNGTGMGSWNSCRTLALASSRNLTKWDVTNLWTWLWQTWNTGTLANDQLDVQIFNTFITILYMHMFRAISCSSSGRQIVLIQHVVSSLSVSDRSVHTCAPDGHLLTVTIPDAVLIQFDVLRMSKILLEHVHVEDCNKYIKEIVHQVGHCLKLY